MHGYKWPINCTRTRMVGALDRLTFRGADEPWARLMDLRYLTYLLPQPFTAPSVDFTNIQISGLMTGI